MPAAPRSIAILQLDETGTVLNTTMLGLPEDGRSVVTIGTDGTAALKPYGPRAEGVVTVPAGAGLVEIDIADSDLVGCAVLFAPGVKLETEDPDPPFVAALVESIVLPGTYVLQAKLSAPAPAAFSLRWSVI